MPVMGASRKRSRGNTEQVDGTRLEGWSFIQEKVLSHDEDMITDYADDIDTLLVFAGLFSAVLTAFLVVSLVLLQPDNSQTTIQILSVIAVRIGAPSDMQPFLNETAQSLPTSTSFRAPTNVVTVNTLWFTSLILSLAAALFGILAKQWCREYLRWHSVIATARDNVLIRQVRFEAWDRWRVGPFIAFVPAFLEIALVLFLVGLLIFVPTFSERSMTIVVSVVIGSVLLGVIVLTILPVFFRLCPFQTPTGWAFVHLASPLRWTFWQSVNWVSVLFDRSLYGANPERVRWRADARSPKRSDWRSTLWLYSQTKLSKLEELTDWRAYGLHSVQDPDLCRPTPAAADIEQACRSTGISFVKAAVDAAQTSTLFRALLWVRLGLKDDSVLAAIQESARTIHLAIPTPWNGNVHFLSAIRAICPTDVSAVLKMVQTYFYDSSENSLSFCSGYKLSDSIGPFIFNQDSEFWLDGEHRAVCEAWTSNSMKLEISHAIIRADLLGLVDEWLSLLTVGEFSTQKDVASRIALLLCMLRILPSQGACRATFEAERYLVRPLTETLEEIYRKLAPHKAAYAHGLVSMCVELSRMWGPIDFECHQGEHYSIKFDTDSLWNFKRDNQSTLSYWNDKCNLFSTWATLAVDIYHNTNHYDEANGRHLFVTSVSRAFETMRRRIAHDDRTRNTLNIDDTAPAIMTELLVCMINALRWSLAHSHPNCGAYISLPWVKAILQCYQAVRNSSKWCGARPLDIVPFTSEPYLHAPFHCILRLLHTSLERELLTGETTADDFRRLLKFLYLKSDHLLELPVPGELVVEDLEASELRPGAETHDPELPGEVITEWPAAPFRVPRRAPRVDTVALTHREEIASGMAASVNGVGALAGPASGEVPEERSAAQTDEGTNPPTNLSGNRPESVDVTMPLSRAIHPHPDIDVTMSSTLPYLLPLPSLPGRPGDDFDAQVGETREETPHPCSTQSLADPRNGPPFTYLPPAPSQLADPDVGPSLLTRAHGQEAPVHEPAMTDSQTESARDCRSVAGPGRGRNADSDPLRLQEQPAEERGNGSAHTHEPEGDYIDSRR